MSVPLDDVAHSPWLEYRTEDHVAYYFNSATNETTWDVPIEFKKWKGSTIDQFLKKSASTWRRYTHEDGRDYYFDKSTKVTQWTPPENVVIFEKELAAYMIEKYTAAYYQSNPETVPSNRNESSQFDTAVDDIPATKKAKITESNSENDIIMDVAGNVDSSHIVTLTTISPESNEATVPMVPSRTREEIQRDKLFDELSKPDSVFEPNTLVILQELMELNASASTVAKTIATSYVGSTQVIPILVAWLEWAKKLQSKSTNQSFDDREESVRKIFNGELSILIKQRFSKEKADAILSKVDSNAAGGVDDLEWLDTLLEEAIFRNIFIHLYNVNITSKFLHMVINMISDKGFNDELADGLSHVDNFKVFSRIVNGSIHRMLTANDVEVGAIIANLQRVTYQNEFYFMYLVSFLTHLMQKMEASRSHEPASFVSIRVSTPMQEDLFGDNEDTEQVVHYNASTYINAHSMLRRLYQEVIYHKNTTVHNEMFALQIVGTYNSRSSSSHRQDKLIMFELYDIVKSNAINVMQCQKLCAYYSDSSNLEHVSRLQDQVILNALIDAFIHPGKAFTATAANGHLSRLIALACIDTISLHDSQAVTTFENELMTAKQYCSDIILDINLSFDDLKISGLTSLIGKHRVVSEMVIRWISYYVQDPSFLSMTTKFYYPIFYHFLVISIDEHPLHHPEIFPIIRKIILISNADSAVGCVASDVDKFTKETMANELVAIQKDAIDCMVYLFGRGYVNITLNFFMESIKYLKTNLLVYLINAVVNAVEAPLSKRFSERYIKFLADSSILAVISNKDFQNLNLERINSILEYWHQHHQTGEYLGHYHAIKQVVVDCTGK